MASSPTLAAPPDEFPVCQSHYLHSPSLPPPSSFLLFLHHLWPTRCAAARASAEGWDLWGGMGVDGRCARFFFSSSFFFFKQTEIFMYVRPRRCVRAPSRVPHPRSLCTYVCLLMAVGEKSTAVRGRRPCVS